LTYGFNIRFTGPVQEETSSGESWEGLQVVNHNPMANVNYDCQVAVQGCTDSSAQNYNPAANYQSGDVFCIPLIPGCMIPSSNTASAGYDKDERGIDGTVINFDPQATEHDLNMCIFDRVGCTDSTAMTYDALATHGDINEYCYYHNVYGCLNPMALNFNCRYDTYTVDQNTPCETMATSGAVTEHVDPLCNYAWSVGPVRIVDAAFAQIDAGQGKPNWFVSFEFVFGIEECPEDSVILEFYNYLLLQGYLQQGRMPARSCAVGSVVVRFSYEFDDYPTAKSYAYRVGDSMITIDGSVNGIADFAASIGLPLMLGGVTIHIEGQSTSNPYPMPMWGVILLSVLVPVFCCCLVVVGLLLYRKKAGGQKPVAPA